MTTSENKFAFLIPIHPDVMGELDSVTGTNTIASTAQHKYLLKETVCYIGRDATVCQIVVSAQRTDIRRKQAKISREGPDYILEDLESPYGTYVNGERLNGRWVLAKGEVIGFGATKEMLIFDDPKKSKHQQIEKLTERELEVLRLVAGGMTNKEIAEHLSISAETVKVRLRTVFKKLEAENRVEAVNKARMLGILPRQ